MQHFTGIICIGLARLICSYNLTRSISRGKSGNRSISSLLISLLADVKCMVYHGVLVEKSGRQLYYSAQAFIYESGV